MKLEEMMGLGEEEEEPKGKIIAGPSGEALEPPDSGNTPFFLSGNLFIQLKHLLIRSSSQIHFIHLESSHSQMSHLKMMNLRVPPRCNLKLIGHAPG